MTVTTDYTVADAKNDAVETAWGASPKLRLYNGTIPANARAALAGNTLLAEGTLPADPMAASASGVKAKQGTWSLTGQAGAGAGTAATFYRIYDNAGSVCKEQGTFGAATTINTSAATAANSNVLTFTSTTGAAIGQAVSGTGVPADTTVLAVSGTQVTLSKATTAGVGSGVAITFGYDMNVDNNSIANGQTININTYQKTAGNL